MKSPFNFIVTPVKGKRYSNTTNIGGMDFITSTSEENHHASNREAIVVETPINYNGPIKIGDTLLVHHNVFKFYNDIKGRRKSGKSFLKDDLFLVDNDQFYLYKQNNKWHSHDRYCFVKPIDKLDSFIEKSFKNEPLMGEVVYPNTYLKSNNIKKGDRVCYTPDSEYEFKVDGEIMFRIYDHQITIKL